MSFEAYVCCVFCLLVVCLGSFLGIWLVEFKFYFELNIWIK